jgi:hypothetical protein
VGGKRKEKKKEKYPKRKKVGLSVKKNGEERKKIRKRDMWWG